MAGKYNGTGVDLEELEANLESLFCNLSHPVRGAQLLQSDRPKRMLAKSMLTEPTACQQPTPTALCSCVPTL